MKLIGIVVLLILLCYLFTDESHEKFININTGRAGIINLDEVETVIWPGAQAIPVDVVYPLPPETELPHFDQYMFMSEGGIVGNKKTENDLTNLNVKTILPI